MSKTSASVFSLPRACLTFAAVLLTVLCLAVSAAVAETRTQFEQGCWVKTRTGVTVYQLDNSDGGLVVGGKNHFTAVGSLSAGTYVRVSSSLEADSMDLVIYWNGGRAKGYIKSNSTTSATMTVRFDDGRSESVPEAYSGDRSALISYLNAAHKNAAYSAIPGSDVIHVQGRSGSTGAAHQASAAKSAPDPDACAFTWQGEQVQVTCLGLMYSTIRTNGIDKTIPTQELTWTTSASAAKQLACVTAAKTGSASLRAKASSKGAVLAKLSTGKAVAVINVGKTYTRVWVDGTIGFVQNGSLAYRANKQPAGLMEGVITYKGRTNSKNEINVRAAGKNGSRILGSYRAGTPVTVISQDKTWTEIEVKGLHCYILSKYVTVTGAAPAPATPTPAATPTPEPTVVPTAAPEQDGDEDDEFYEPYETGTPLEHETEFGYDFDSEIDGDAIS